MAKLISTNPSRGYEPIGEVEISNDQEIKENIEKANSASLGWKAIGVSGRKKALEQAYEHFFQKKEDLALLVAREIGMPILQTRTEDVSSGLKFFRWYLDHAEQILAPETTYEDEESIHQVFYEPIGTSAVIVPWNFPVSNFIWGVIPNLLAGNPVVFKHSEECPLTGKMLEEILESSELPEGVFSEIYGDGAIGDKLVHQEIDLIWFTGSSATGKYLYKVASEKFVKVVLELGGSAPGIVFEDVDLEKALGSAVYGRFVNCGQVCDGLKRLIVHETRAQEVVERMKALLEAKKIGDAEDETTDVGPLVAKRQLEKLISQVEDAREKGATVVTGGDMPQGLSGAYFLPTLLTSVSRDMRIWKEEVFGPVLPMVTFKTEEEAIQLANDTPYGLGAYVFTANKERAKRVAAKLESGMVSINGTSYVMPQNPFGGYKESGMGREHGKYGLHELSQIKVVSREK